jgi:parvulin-like peptidyl-prolyl isomerase
VPDGKCRLDAASLGCTALVLVKDLGVESSLHKSDGVGIILSHSQDKEPILSFKFFAFLSVLALLLAACSVGELPPQNVPPTLPPTLPAPTATAPKPASLAQATVAPTAVPANAPAAARVNGQVILQSEFEKNVARRQAEMAKQGINLSTPEGQAALAEMRSQILEGMIEQELIDQEAAKQGITVTQAEVDTAVNQSIADSGGADAFNKYLTDVAGMTLDEYREGQREGMLTQKVIDRVTRDVPMTGEQVHARHILLNTKAEADSVLAQLRAGADFATLAQRYSKDTITSAGGGDLGWFPRGGLFDAALEKAAFDLQPGQISGVVQSDLGGQTVYHIVQVIERDPARALSDDALLAARRAAFQKWLDDLKAAAKIERLVK